MKSQRLGLLRLYRNLDKILLLFFTVFMLMELAWVPFNSFAAETLLKQTGYLFLSYTNAFKSSDFKCLGWLSLSSAFCGQSLYRLFSDWTDIYGAPKSSGRGRTKRLSVY